MIGTFFFNTQMTHAYVIGGSLTIVDVYGWCVSTVIQQLFLILYMVEGAYKRTHTHTHTHIHTQVHWHKSYPDNSPPYRFWSWWVVLVCVIGPSGELSWWGILVIGIVVLVGNGWALCLSGGELSSWGVVLEPTQIYMHTICTFR